MRWRPIQLPDEVGARERRMRGLIVLFVLAAGLPMLALTQVSHRVNSGESLDSIGRKYNVSPSAIAQLNNLSNPDLIVPGDVLRIPDPPGSPARHEVKAGDTIGGIAVTYGSTTKSILEANRIENPENLQVGQILIVPRAPAADAAPSAVAAAPTERYPLPAALKRRLDGIPVGARRWTYIVVHHSASRNGTMQGMDMYHRQKRHMENGLAYHFVIGNGNGIPDGKIEIGNRWLRQIKGGHLASDNQNYVAIGICLVGNFEAAPPTAAQMQSLYALVGYLRKRCNIAKKDVKTHTEINVKPTACPGRRFPTQQFRNNI